LDTHEMDVRPISIVRDKRLIRTAVFLRTQLQNSFHNSYQCEDGKVLVKEQLKGNTIALTTDTVYELPEQHRRSLQPLHI